MKPSSGRSLPAVHPLTPKHKGPMTKTLKIARATAEPVAPAPTPANTPARPSELGEGGKVEEVLPGVIAVTMGYVAEGAGR